MLVRGRLRVWVGCASATVWGACYASRGATFVGSPKSPPIIKKLKRDDEKAWPKKLIRLNRPNGSLGGRTDRAN